jgi:Recombination endonuclease VII
VSAAAYQSWPVLTVPQLRDAAAARYRCLPGASDHPRLVDELIARLFRPGWGGVPALLAWHAGRCAVCGVPAPLVLDHCHRTALARGYLCGSCNTLEGFGHGGPFVAYRARPPAAVLGIVETYCSPVTGDAEPEPARQGWEGGAHPLSRMGL